MRAAIALILGLLVGCSTYTELVPNGTTGLEPLDDPTTSTDSSTGIDLSSSDDSGGAAFLPFPDAGTKSWPCSTFAQDCPANEKCMPYSNDGGGVWNDVRCSPIAVDAASVGEPCRVEGNRVSGLDDCDLGLICWDVNPETNIGSCLPMCSGSADAPLCDDPNRTCTQNGAGVLNLCQPRCHPLVQDCREGQGCYLTYYGFTCSPDASGDAGAAYEPCEFLNTCDPGLVCVAPDHDACEAASGCCKTLCKVGESGSPCPPLEECVPWYWTDDPIPNGLEDIGHCEFPDL